MILGALAVLVTAAVALVAWFALDKAAEQANVKRTEPARAARWPEKKEDAPEKAPEDKTVTV